jgi:hypothetical protein
MQGHSPVWFKGQRDSGMGQVRKSLASPVQKNADFELRCIQAAF